MEDDSIMSETKRPPPPKVRPVLSESSQNFSARLKYQSRHCPGVLWDEIFRSDNKEMYKEELRRQRQRRLGRKYHRQTAKRLGVKPYETSSSSDEDEEAEGNKDPPLTEAARNALNEIEMLRQEQLELARRKFEPARLSNVSIHHPRCIGRGGGQGRNDATGTLEANLTGFRWYSNFEINVMYSDIKYALTRDGVDNKPPLFHLHLSKPIMVGTEMTEDIQFHLVQSFDGSKKRPAKDSNKFDKQQQKSADDNNKVMREFRRKVDSILDTLPLMLRCDWVDTKRGFFAEVHSKKHPPFSAIFVFLYSALIQLDHKPFTVITLKEIELVNLVHTGIGEDTFSMTIVFKDFTHEVLLIKSIPVAERLSIKERLDLSKVKFYENKLDIPDWGIKMMEINADVNKFIKEDGGWKFLSVEESASYLDSSGDEYSIGSYSSDTDEEPEQTCPSVPNGKGNTEQFVSETGNFSDSSLEKLANSLGSHSLLNSSLEKLANSLGSDILVNSSLEKLANSLGSHSLVKFDKYSYSEPGQASGSDPRNSGKAECGSKENAGNGWTIR